MGKIDITQSRPFDAANAVSHNTSFRPPNAQKSDWNSILSVASQNHFEREICNLPFPQGKSEEAASLLSKPGAAMMPFASHLEHKNLNIGVAGSSPAVGFLIFSFFFYFHSQTKYIFLILSLICKNQIAYINHGRDL
jgi:hypothetical protein